MGERDSEPIRAELRERLTARPEIDFAYLFGSFIEGLPYHDLDVAVFLRPALPRETIFDYEMTLSVELTLALHVEVDVHVLNAAPCGFQHSALQGELLLARDEERLTSFIEHVAWEYMEFAYHGEIYLREVLS
jgi:predicted nucleotidyltransferase